MLGCLVIGFTGFICLFSYFRAKMQRNKAREKLTEKWFIYQTEQSKLKITECTYVILGRII